MACAGEMARARLWGSEIQTMYSSSVRTGRPLSSRLAFSGSSHLCTGHTLPSLWDQAPPWASQHGRRPFVFASWNVMRKNRRTHR